MDFNELYIRQMNVEKGDLIVIERIRKHGNREDLINNNEEYVGNKGRIKRVGINSAGFEYEVEDLDDGGIWWMDESDFVLKNKSTRAKKIYNGGE